jgi:phospholipid transport system substrate-binding protein
MSCRSKAAAAAIVLTVCGAVVCGASVWGGATALAGSPAAPQTGPVQLAQAHTAQAWPEAGTFISSLAHTAITGLTDKTLSPEEREQRFRTLLTTDFDIPEIARFVLGRYWRVATPDERTQYTKLFEDYIVQIYSSRFQDYGGETLKVTSAYRDDDGAFVSSSLFRPSGPPVKVDWRLRPQAPTFKIVDIMVEGVSMSVTQRDDFAAAIQEHGGKVAGLIDLLRQKVQTAAK